MMAYTCCKHIFIIHYKKPKELEPYRVIAVDASDIVQKGTVKKTWHLHYGDEEIGILKNNQSYTSENE